MKFWILWGFDSLVAFVFVYFFVIGLADGSVSSFNIVLWLAILGALASVLAVPIWLRKTGHGISALLVLLVVALPAILFLLFFLVLILSHPRWN